MNAFSTERYVNTCGFKGKLHQWPKISIFLLYLKIIDTFLKKIMYVSIVNCQKKKKKKKPSKIIKILVGPKWLI